MRDRRRNKPGIAVAERLLVKDIEPVTARHTVSNNIVGRMSVWSKHRGLSDRNGPTNFWRGFASS